MFSFHETKNGISGEDGALLVTHERFAERAEIVREKGTNRSEFFRGQVDKYTWLEVGSSYLYGGLVAAFLLAQFESAEEIIRERIKVRDECHKGFAELESRGVTSCPVVPADCLHNAHMYYLLGENLDVRTRLIQYLRDHGLHAVALCILSPLVGSMAVLISLCS